MALTVTITGDATQLAAALQRLEQGVQATGTKVDRLFEQMSDHTQRSTQRMMESLDRMQVSMTQSFNVMSATVTRFLGLLASFGATVSFAGLVQGAVQVAGGFEQLDTQLRFVVGTMEAFQQARQFILQFTATTPFQLQEVSKAFIDLTRRGFEVERTLKAVGDAASLQRFPSQALDRVVFALGQIADRGKLAQQELNQLSEAGVPISRVREELSALGVSIGEDIGAAGISARQGIEAILRVLEKDFAGAMKATQGNWVILTSNLADAWNIFQDTIVRGPLFDFLKGLTLVILEEMNAAITEGGDAFRAFGAVAVDALQRTALGIATILDLFGQVLRVGATVQGVIAGIERSGADMMTRVGQGLKTFLGLGAAVEQIQTDVAQAGQAVAQAFSANAPVTQALEETFARAKAASDAANAERERVLKANEARVAQMRRQLAQTVAGDDGSAATSAAAAKSAAKTLEQALEQSLKRQEAIIAQSFDERRSMADAFFAEEIRKAPGDAAQIGQLKMEQLRLMAQEEATMLESIRLASNDALLAKLLVTTEEHAARQEQIFAKTAEIRRRLNKEVLDEEIKDLIRANELMEQAREQGLEDFAKQTRQIEHKMAQEQERIQTSQLRSYENFVNRVAGMLNDIFTGLLDGTLSAVDFFKRLLIAQLANIGSSVIAPFIASIAAGVAGALSSALPSALGNILGQGVFGPAGAPSGGLASLGGQAFQGAGILSGLLGPQGGLGQAFSWFGDQLNTAGSALADLFGIGGVASPALVASLPGGSASLPAGAMSGAGVLFRLLGGLGGLGGGIFSALNASTIGGMAGGAVGAAGGATALAATLAPALIGGLAPILGPIGLALAAIAPLLGNFLGGLSAPAGPRFALGGLGGLGIGAQGGALALSGQLSSSIGRQQRIPSGVDTSAIQASLQTTVTNLVQGMVEALNQVAIDPTELLGPTQDALNDALANALRINTSSAKNFQKDMEAQVKFVGVQVSSFFLRPLNDAFRQLESAELDQQISRLPETTQGMVEVFKGMNTQLDELSKVANTDVLRQLSGVRNRVEDFGNALADTARVVSESIVNQISDQLLAQANVLFDRPLSQQISQFAGLMNQSLAALESLRTTQRGLQGAGLNAGGITGQLQRLSTVMVETAGEVSTDIVTGSLSELSTGIEQMILQPLRIQATTVNSLFTDSMNALNALWEQWHRLEGAGLDASGIQQQFERLLGGLLTSAIDLTSQAFQTGNLTEFVNVLLSIPEALTAMNPVLQQMRQLGVVLAQVAVPIQQVIDSTRTALQTPRERADETAQQMRELAAAIAQTGDALDRALPLYGQLAQAIQANSAAWIEAVNAAAEAQTQAVNAAVEAARDAINQRADVATRALQERTDTLTAILNAQTEAATAGWNQWADMMMDSLNAWVNSATTALNTWAQAAQTTASQLAQVNDILLNEMSPAQQRTELEAQKAMLEAVVAMGGAGSQEAMSELIRVNQALLGLAKQSDNLALQKQSIAELERIQKYLTEQLVAATGFSDPVLAQIAVNIAQRDWLVYIAGVQKIATDYIQTTQAAAVQAIATSHEQQQAQIAASHQLQQAQIAAQQKLELDHLHTNQNNQLMAIEQWQSDTVDAIKIDMINKLQDIQDELGNIYGLQYKLATGQPLDAQRGGVIMASMNRAGTGPLAFAGGGMVPVMLEPRERVFTPPMSQAQQGALMSMNQAFPRFAGGGLTVPGSGSGDTVPALVPSGSFVMNRRAAGTLGYQQGGAVPMRSGEVHLHLDLRGAVFHGGRDGANEIIRIVEEYFRKVRVQTRMP